MKTVKCIALLVSFSLFGITAYAQTAAQNKATLLKVYDYLNAKNYDGFASTLADNFVDYAMPQPAIGATAAVEGLKAYFGAFPDVKMTVEKIVAEGNTVMAYITMTGTFTNDFMDMKATGKSFKIMDVDIIEFNSAGKAVAHWSVQDPMVMMSQVMK